MKKEFPVVDENVTLKDAIIKMTEGKLGHVLFMENNKVKALLSDGDLRRAMMSEDFNLEKAAIEFATKNPKTIKEDMLASDALQFMEEKKIQFLPVVDESGNVVGVIHLHHLVEAGIK